MNLHSLDLNLLLVLDAVMKDRHVSKAALRIGRSQSALSHSLKKLRIIFNDELFVRKAGQMAPTPRALELAGPVSTILADIQGTLDRYYEFDPAQSLRHFKIGISDSTAFMFLPSLARSVRQQSPNITISAINVSDYHGYQLLRSGDLDCVVLGNAPAITDDLHSETVLTEPFLSAMWSQNPISKAPLTLAAFLSCSHLNVAVDGKSPGQVDIALQKMNLKRYVAMTIPLYRLAPLMLRDTDLILTIGVGNMLALAESHEIKLRKPPIELPDVEFSVITDKRVHTDPGIIWLRSLLQKRADEMKKKRKDFYRKL
jgi:DNA-binding transcriptional LysR family regulator